jgi:uncharacterized protein with von Willebrand factor type A (vWA) domain
LSGEPSVKPDELAVAFATAARHEGMAIPTGCVVTFARALAAVGVDREKSVYWAGRATMVHHTEDIARYDAAFARFWRGETGSVRIQVPLRDSDPDRSEVGDELVGAVRFSATEVLRDKDFAAYSHDEFAEARRLMADLRVVGALRRSRRVVPGRRGRPDVRRTVRAALRSGGEPLRRSWLTPGVRRRRVVLLCDVSGSMEPYARALLRFAHAAVGSRRGRVEAFTLGTRLTRLTRELATRDPDVALARSSAAVLDWSGGTRLGEALRAFNDRYGVPGMARGAVIVILSDGWDRGDPALIGSEMARLKRVAHRIVWVNPLKSSPGYAPLASGMAAALPYVDDFVEGHSLAALESLVEVISR